MPVTVMNNHINPMDLQWKIVYNIALKKGKGGIHLKYRGEGEMFFFSVGVVSISVDIE